MVPLLDQSFRAVPFGVIPVLAPLLPVVLAIVAGFLVALAGVLISLLRPRTMKSALKLLWRLKISVALVVVGSAGVVWAARSLWPDSPTAAAQAAESGRDWPVFRGRLARTGGVPRAPEPTRPGLNWVFKSGKAGFFSSPAVVGNRVYVASATTAIIGGGSGQIYCFDADTGSVIWQAAPPGYRATFSSPVIQGNYLVCGEGLHFTRDARIICLDLRPGHEGRVLWTHRTGSHVECAPVIHNGHVYIGAGDDGYYCIKLEPGPDGRARVVWHVPGDNYPDAETSLVAYEDRIYAGLGLGGKAICVLDAATGEELHRISTGFPVFGPPAIAGGKLYVGMGNGDYVHQAEEIDMQPVGAVWCIDLATLTVDWKYTVGRTVLGAVAVAGDQLYFASRDGYLHCIGTDGKPVGNYNAHAPTIASAAVGDRYAYVVTDSGMLYVLDRHTLELVWEFKVGTKPLLVSSPAVARGHVYVGTQFDGFLCVGFSGEEEEVPLWPGRLGGPGKGGNLDDTPLAELGAFHWQYPADQMGETQDRVVAAPVAALGQTVFVPLAGGDARSGVACLPAEDKADETPKPRWVYRTNNGVYLSPALSGETLFVVDGRPAQADRHLHAVEITTGRRRWRTPVAGDASGVFACTGEDLYLQDRSDRLSCFDLSGRRLWSQRLGKLGRAVAVADSLVVAAVADPASLVAMDRPTGRRLWRAKLTSAPTTSPALEKDTIYLGTSAGLEARSLVDGTPRDGWRVQPGGVSSDFVLSRQIVAYVSHDGKLIVASRDDGTIIRQQPGAIPGIAPLLSRKTLLYSAKEGLMGFLLGDAGAEPSGWVDTSWLGSPATPMVLCDSNVYLGMAGWGLVRLGTSR